MSIQKYSISIDRSRRVKNMIWGDKKLKKLVELGMIENTYEGAINPASIDCIGIFSVHFTIIEM